MDYEYFSNKIGVKFALVRGELVEDPKGEFSVSFDFTQYSIYLNKITRTWNLIVPEKSYIGRNYILKKSDCISLCAEWLDDHGNTNFVTRYSKASNREFIKYFNLGMQPWFEDNGFTEVTTPIVGDCVVYSDSINGSVAINHAGVYISEGKILQHLPNRFSSIDSLDLTKVIKCYRYG